MWKSVYIVGQLFDGFSHVLDFFAVVCDDLLVIRMLDRNMSINMLLILCIPDGIADCTWDVILAVFDTLSRNLQDLPQKPWRKI